MNNRVMNGLGQLAYRISSVGMLVVINVIAAHIMERNDFGRLFIITSSLMLLIGIVDFYNQKYMISLFSNNKLAINIHHVFFSKILSFVTFPFIYCYFHFYLKIPSSTSILALFVILTTLLSQTVSTYFFCNKRISYCIVYASAIALFFTFLFSMPLYLVSSVSMVNLFILACVIYRVFEFFILYLYLENKGKFNFKQCVDFFRQNRRHVFYVQNFLSLFSSKSYAIILPSLLTAGDLSTVGKFYNISSIYYFYLAFLSSAFYRDSIESTNITKLLISKVRESVIGATVILICIYLYMSVYKSELHEYFYLICIIFITSALTSFIGYLLLFYKKDNYLLVMSIVTIFINFSIYYSLIPMYKVTGFFYSLIIIELFSLTMFVFIMKHKAK